MTRLRTRAVYADQLPAHSRNFMVVAEGVEAWHEHDILKTEGCDYQGCLEARPMLADQLTPASTGAGRTAELQPGRGHLIFAHSSLSTLSDWKSAGAM